jgi:hypothetical protein
MMNNWKPDKITLTKGLLSNLKMFIGILDSGNSKIMQLENN